MGIFLELLEVEDSTKNEEDADTVLAGVKSINIKVKKRRNKDKNMLLFDLDSSQEKVDSWLASRW